MVGKKIIQVIKISLISFAAMFAFALVLYIKILPAAVENPQVINLVEVMFHKYVGIQAEIENPFLKTEFSPKIGFGAGKIRLVKGDENLLFADNLETEISLAEIFEKRIVVNKFGADNLFADVNKILAAFGKQQEQTTQKSDWDIDLFDSVLYLKHCTVIYDVRQGTQVKVIAKNLGIDNTQKVERFVHFDIDIDITKNNKTVHVAFADENKVIIKNKAIYLNDCALYINNSKMFFNAYGDKKNNYEVSVYAKRFFIPDVIKLLLTDVVENNIRDVLAYFDRINGDFDFGITLDNSGMNGEIRLNKVVTKIVPINHLPIEITAGKIKLDEKNIILSGVEGFYDNKKTNTFNFEGDIKDYLKSIDTTIDMKAKLTDDFTKKYISPMVGTPIELTGVANSKIVIKSIYNKIDIMMAGKVAKGDDILVDGASLSPTNYDRALKADLHFEDNVLNIKDINYYIASELKKGVKVKPILTLKGNFDVANNKLLDLGFEIPKPLPSEFLNVLIGQKLFKKGTFAGTMSVDNRGEYPILKGDMTAEKIIIPSQRLYLKKGSLKTNAQTVDIYANGKYRRAGYDFKGKITNAIKYPIVIKDINFTIDEVDIDKMLTSMNTTADQNQTIVATDEKDIENDEGAPTFDMSNIIVEKCLLQVLKGNYKDIKFSDVKADLTLDKNSMLEVKSNRFDIAEGHSSTKINCDLKNHKYSIVLGIKDVNSDLMSTTILNLPREISGKASGLMSLHTDDSLKLNGEIKFNVKDGQIQKIGLVEYVLKFAALFRNPIATISPSTFSDLVNIPDGRFEKISGNMQIKDNVIQVMKIKSAAPQLSAYIVGRYDIEHSDAILRIYTKFSNKNKGFAGALRNISLNSLANRISLTGRNDANYYAAELAELPEIDADEKDCQIFLTKVDGDVEHNNFISSLKKIK